jgi:enoyl-CoA hydratase/carnithine racemase
MSADAADHRSPDESGEVRLAVEGAIATLTLSRPRAHNALTWAMYDQLSQHLDWLAGQESIRVVVVRGDGGRAFAAGTDIRQFQSFGADDGIAYEARIDHILSKLLQLEKPTVAAIEGYAVGGGLGIAAMCDLRYANTRARLGVPVARTLGNCLALQTYRRLATMFGSMKLKELIYTGRLMDAQEGLAAGFLTAVFPDDAFGARLAEVVAQIAANAPLTLWATKVALTRLEAAAWSQTQEVPFADVVRRVYGSEDFHNAVVAHTTKSPPVWRGR